MTDIRVSLKQKTEAEQIFLSEKQLSQFQTYTQQLLLWNEKMNLTAITDPEEIVVKHFLDSLLLSSFLPEKTGFRFADVGTGAGFPGIPLLLLRPDLRLVLIDSLQKRLTFLKSLCGMLSLSPEYLHARAEDCGRNPKYREAFDFVTARAVAPLNVLTEYCLPLLKVGGIFVAMKGPGGQEEAATAAHAIQLLGGRVIRVVTKTLSEDLTRTFLVVEKTRPVPEKYPRRGVKIAKNPL